MTGALVLKNLHSTEVQVALEPWTDEAAIMPGGAIEIAFEGPAGGRIEIETKPGEITVYGWAGGILSFVVPARV